MDARALVVKVYVEQPGKKPEIRRFALDENAARSLDCLKAKILNGYQSTEIGSFNICWKDDEGDMITVGSDDELQYAVLNGSESGILRLYLTTRNSEPSNFTESKPSEGPVHTNIFCDGCDSGIKGLRFKCLVCPDYDLCSSCCSKGTHNHHYMLRMAFPSTDWNGSGCARQSGWWWPGNGGRGGPAANMRRFWRHFMARQGGNPCSKSADSNQQQSATSAAPPGQEEERDYLTHVGEQVSELLKPLGIDIDFLVEERPNAGASGMSNQNQGSAGAPEANVNPAGACLNKPPTGTSPNGGPKNKNDVKLDSGVTNDRRQGDVEMEDHSWVKVEPKTEDMDAQAASSAQRTEQPGTTQAGASGIYPSINNPSAPLFEYPSTSANGEPVRPAAYNSAPGFPQSAPHNGETPRPFYSAPRCPPLFANRPGAAGSWPSPFGSWWAGPQTSAPPRNDLAEKVAQAVDQMKAMGFHDEGGWMTAMLYENNGEIYKVIDAVLAATNKMK